MSFVCHDVICNRDPRRYFFCGSFMFLFCLVFAMSLCASVYMCFVTTCWERADLLALICGVYYEFVTFPLVSWVRCGTWVYRFLIFAPYLLWDSWSITELKYSVLPMWCPCSTTDMLKQGYLSAHVDRIISWCHSTLECMGGHQQNYREIAST